MALPFQRRLSKVSVEFEHECIAVKEASKVIPAAHVEHVAAPLEAVLPAAAPRLWPRMRLQGRQRSQAQILDVLEGRNQSYLRNVRFVFEEVLETDTVKSEVKSEPESELLTPSSDGITAALEADLAKVDVDQGSQVAEPAFTVKFEDKQFWCPQGHELVQKPPAQQGCTRAGSFWYHVRCDACSAECYGQTTWRCDPCNWDVCPGCHPSKRRRLC